MIFDSKKMEEGFKMLSEKKAISLYGSVDNSKKFINGLKSIEEKYADFFKNKDIGSKNIENYFTIDNVANKPRLEFRKYNKLNDAIEKEVLVLFNSLLL
ncbi:hypothetical protein ACKGJY_15210 [Hyunsoonleella sp. 2307UL5-6]|uniref:hypothetical protein n=1 Tax=Hyunsoonleella sp. 2307UL5-6 TaxID=3384768 RepID=UPI0039BCE68A